jgi:hypothetical protein
VPVALLDAIIAVLGTAGRWCRPWPPRPSWPASAATTPPSRCWCGTRPPAATSAEATPSTGSQTLGDFYADLLARAHDDGGCAAGFSGDRTDAAAPVVQALIASGQPAVLIFETLAERTLALAQLARRTQPDAGYEPLLVDLLQPVLADCLAHGVRIVSNFGAANPAGAARRIHQLAAELGLRAPRIAVVQGDDLSGPHTALLERALGPAMPTEPIVSANAYIGAQAIADALRAGADIVVCGRVADPSLVLGPAMAHYGWAADDWDRLARATMAGHLLECGAQVTGGYFADPGYKDVPGLATLGYPIAEIDPDGHCTITKPAGTGGCINERTVKEQLLYELHDPAPT